MMNRTVTLQLSGALALALAFPAAALAEAMPAAGSHGHASHGAAAAPADTPATTAFRDINSQMHREMDVAYTNDVDVDFMRSMIPHHEGAVAMAMVVLEHSAVPEVRALAEAVVEAQEAEIALMRAYLRDRGVID